MWCWSNQNDSEPHETEMIDGRSLGLEWDASQGHPVPLASPLPAAAELRAALSNGTLPPFPNRKLSCGYNGSVPADKQNVGPGWGSAPDPHPLTL